MVLALILTVPVILLLLQICLSGGSAGNAGAVAASCLKRFIKEPVFLKSLAVSVSMALAATLMALALGIPGAYIMATFRFPAKGFFRALFELPLIMPVAITGALSFRILFGTGGLLEFLSPALFSNPYAMHIAVTLMMGLTSTPVVITLVGRIWSNLDFRCEEEARSLGSSRSMVFHDITYPRLRNSVASSAGLVFIQCLTGFTLAFSLLSDACLPTISMKTYSLFASGDIEMASVLSLVSLVITLVVLLASCGASASELKKNYENPDFSKVERKPGGAAGILVALYLLASLVLSLSPMVLVALRSAMTPEGFGITAYMELFAGMESPGIKSLVYSLLIAFVSALIGTFTALRLSAVPRPGILRLLPLATGPVIIGMGYAVLGTMTKNAIPPIVLVALSHIAVTMPVTSILLVPCFQHYRDDLSSASRTLGFGGSATFRNIEYPAFRNVVYAAFLYSIAISMGNLPTTLLTGGIRSRTLAVLIHNFMTDSSMQEACALCTVLLAICLILFAIGGKLKRKCHV